MERFFDNHYKERFFEEDLVCLLYRGKERINAGGVSRLDPIAMLLYSSNRSISIECEDGNELRHPVV